MQCWILTAISAARNKLMAAKSTVVKSVFDNLFVSRLAEHQLTVNNDKPIMPQKRLTRQFELNSKINNEPDNRCTHEVAVVLGITL